MNFSNESELSTIDIYVSTNESTEVNLAGKDSVFEFVTEGA